MPISRSTIEILSYFVLQQNKQLLTTISNDYDIDFDELMSLIPKRHDIVQALNTPESPKTDNTSKKKVVKKETK